MSIQVSTQTQNDCEYLKRFSDGQIRGDTKSVLARIDRAVLGITSELASDSEAPNTAIFDHIEPRDCAELIEKLSRRKVSETLIKLGYTLRLPASLSRYAESKNQKIDEQIAHIRALSDTLKSTALSLAGSTQDVERAERGARTLAQIAEGDLTPLQIVTKKATVRAAATDALARTAQLKDQHAQVAKTTSELTPLPTQAIEDIRARAIAAAVAANEAAPEAIFLLEGTPLELATQVRDIEIAAAREKIAEILSKGVPTGNVGIRNGSNSCYMASVLQSMRLNPVMRYLVDRELPSQTFTGAFDAETGKPIFNRVSEGQREITEEIQERMRALFEKLDSGEAVSEDDINDFREFLGTIDDRWNEKLCDDFDHVLATDGLPMDENGNLINDDGRLIDITGQLVDEMGNLVNEAGMFIDEDGNAINEQGELVDLEGVSIGVPGNINLNDDGSAILRRGNILDPTSRQPTYKQQDAQEFRSSLQNLLSIRTIQNPADADECFISGLQQILVTTQAVFPGKGTLTSDDTPAKEYYVTAVKKEVTSERDIAFDPVFTLSSDKKRVLSANMGLSPTDPASSMKKLMDLSTREIPGTVIELSADTPDAALLRTRLKTPGKRGSEPVMVGPEGGDFKIGRALNIETAENNPPSLTFNLKRTAFHVPTLTAVRLSGATPFPDEIKLDDASNAKNPKIPYEISSCVCHFGDSPNSGHYIDYTKINGRWYEFNDGSVSLAPTFNPQTSNNLFSVIYTRTDLVPRPSIS